MYPEHLSHKDGERDKCGGDDEKGGDDGVTRSCDSVGGMRKTKR